MSVQAITFDFWNTLFRDANAEARQAMRIRAFAEAARVSEEETAAALNKVWSEFSRHHIEKQRTLRSRDAVLLAATALDVSLEPETVERLARVLANAVLFHSPEPIEGALDAVRAAAARVRVGLVSDTGVSPGRALRRLLERHAFAPHFSALTFSDEAGGAKSRAAVFKATARVLGVRPRDILHIGDLEHTDIAGAKALDARAALFTAVTRPHGSPETRADYVFASWAEFLDALPGIVNGS